MPRSRRSLHLPQHATDASGLARRSLLALAVTAGLAACGRKPDYLQAPPPPPETSPEQAPEEAPQ